MNPSVERRQRRPQLELRLHRAAANDERMNSLRQTLQGGEQDRETFFGYETADEADQMWAIDVEHRPEFLPIAQRPEYIGRDTPKDALRGSVFGKAGAAKIVEGRKIGRRPARKQTPRDSPFQTRSEGQAKGLIFESIEENLRASGSDDACAERLKQIVGPRLIEHVDDVRSRLADDAPQVRPDESLAVLHRIQERNGQHAVAVTILRTLDADPAATS